MELAQAWSIEDKLARERYRKAALQKVVNLGNRAKDAKEILDIFMDGVEDNILKKMAVTNDTTSLLYLKMYYKACLDLEAEFDGMIKQALLKENTLDVMKKGKGE
jgi:transcription termination factor NusB